MQSCKSKIFCNTDKVVSGFYTLEDDICVQTGLVGLIPGEQSLYLQSRKTS